MKNSSGVVIPLITLVLAFFLGYFVGSDRTVSHKEAVAAGCGHYDAKTGEFTLGASDD